MKRFGFGGKRLDAWLPSPAAVGVEAGGERSVAINTEGGYFTGTVLTGDGSRVVQPPPPEAWQPISTVDAPPGLDDLPVRPGWFVGRERELDKLDSALAHPGQVVVQAVHGLGGIGKSTLVAHWAATRAHGHAPVRWITAGTATDVERGLAKFAAALQPMLAQEPVEVLADRALQWLATHRGWLLVLDNVNDRADIADVLARGETGRIVITSRLSSGWRPTDAVVRLDVLDPVESLRLLTGILGAAGPRDEDGAAELCVELGHLPLAVEQVGSYLAQNPLTTPRAYTRLLVDYPADMYGRAAVGVDPERTIARIWRVSLERITAAQPIAADLLRALAWYGPDGIPLTLCQHLASPPAVDAALGVLRAYSMITLDPATATVSIHRLVQAVSRTADPEDPHRSPEAVEHAHTAAAAALYAALPDTEDPAARPAWRALLPHIDAFLGHDHHDTVTTMCILDTTARVLIDQGLNIPAITYLHRALIDCRQLLGASHPDRLIIGNNLAYAYVSAGRADLAIPLYELVLADSERIFGVDHDNTLTSRSNLATAYRSVGRLDEAIRLHRQTVADRERVLGPDHLDTLTSRHNLASAYESAGRTDRAIPLFERVLADSERLLGLEHPDTLTSRHCLADACKSAGRTLEATRLDERTLADRERILGDEHPHTLSSRNNLAYSHKSAGRLTEAIELYERTLADYERILTPAHPDTMTTRNNLAAAYKSAGRVHEAIPLYERTIADSERVLGPDHPSTLRARHHLAEAYRLVGQISEAIPLHEQTLADRERTLGGDHPDTLASRNDLACTYRSAGWLDRATSLYERTFADCERVLGREHTNTLTTCLNLVDAYGAAGRLADLLRLSVHLSAGKPADGSSG